VRGVGVCIDIWVGGGIVEGKGLADGATKVDEGKGEAVDEGGWDTKAIACEDNKGVFAED
jgi:hypothetical protein